jgi:hypothetical protein
MPDRVTILASLGDWQSRVQESVEAALSKGLLERDMLALWLLGNR